MQNIKALYLSQLDALREEISLYKNESDLWVLNGEIKNTPGNLCLHICGNLNYFIGDLIGNTGYVRDRDKEFSDKNIGRETLYNNIEDTKNMIAKVFDDLGNDDFAKIYPDNKFGENPTYAFVFARLISHLSYHLGQINYHRRITEV
ncbi:MAG: DUF1572 family protein [Ignavibacteria bacterium]|nr:DUF1572 family protein [Ignavibacteria bacterium]